MNILIMTNMFPPIRTGSSHYAVDLAKVLHKAGHNITVVTVKLKNYNPVKDEKYPYQIIRLPNIHLKFKALFDFFTVTSLNLLNYLRLIQIIKKNNIQVIHQVSHYLDTAIITRIISKITKVPYVVSVHTQLDFEEKFYKPVLTFADRIICGNFILKGANNIISLDNEILRYLKNTHNKKWLDKKNVIVPHGIYINNNKFKYKENYDFSNLIVSIGHVINMRNRFSLIRAMKIVTKEFPDIKLEIIGRIYYLKTKELINELGLNKNVILVGELSQEDTINRLIKADINAVWINSEYVGMGTAISESMLCGVPVVNNSPEDLLGENKLKNMENIVLVNSKNIDEIAHKIIMLLNDISLREKIGRAGREFIYQHMDINKTKDMLINVYKSIQK